MAEGTLSVAEHRRQLLARSELYRQNLADETLHVRESFSWTPRNAGTFRKMLPFVAVVGVPVLFLLLRRKRRHHSQSQAPKRRGIIGKLWRGFQIYRQVRPVVDTVMRLRGARVRHPSQAR